MQTRPKLLYPSMVIAAISVTVFSLLGIAALTGNMPFAHSEPAATEKPTGENPAATGSSKALSPEAAAACHNCGTVLSINQIETRGSGTGIGAVAGGLAGAFLGNGMGQGNGRTAMTLLGGVGGAYAGNEIEKNTHKSMSYQVRVRMEDGRIRQIYQRDPPAVSVGDHVQITNGMLSERS